MSDFELNMPQNCELIGLISKDFDDVYLGTGFDIGIVLFIRRRKGIAGKGKTFNVSARL